jgi:hydroxyacyl-ACP dehydratase HTD2-like protein with hotdog domain
MPALDSLTVGTELPGRDHRPDNVDLFLYNAVLWNAHRIHYDERYATEVEGYPGLVVPGPLLGDWLTQVVMEWLGEDGVLLTFEYSNRQAAYLGETLRACGRVTSIDGEAAEATLALEVRNERGDVITPGSAVVRLGKAAA